NKPNILVPLPATVSRGDQIENAEFAHSAGYSKVLQEDELNVEILTRTIREVFSNRSFWQERLSKFGSKDALALIISEIERAIADVD
ncbi:MAG TPA: UDP-N-acetylglucosamine--N-acetylmuramyl-(pentapeptide) pyrophosphoryl-undecaprenol N-acetylglucosamine transferase, partial [Gammaproteobacteria bacterium]|nr:UDP-N-acetylglucosamine--N-acetylmuramyl-(pentapeptide) pyrophosphoryl-undecaprenol N-acetylglucosamine transferase [Gammaproteobacteria bacterium]